MTSARLDTNGAPTEGAEERSQQGSREDEKGVRGGNSGDWQGLSNEDESRINEDVNDERAVFVEAQTVQHSLQKQPQGLQVLPGQVVCWERFLPLRSLKVLLVENDDSTRHVVSALLRNCSYEVTAVANGLEAWKILEDLTNHIDLVLTEVDMPFLSGIGLLSKIMNHKTRSNIPVIMMSSNDSMGIVFTCLSKGATDFLVKPIRKNELKNLWQHVWRKCHSSSGSGSESGIRPQKSTKSKSVEGSKNDTDSNDEADNGSIGLNARDGSDNGSGTQSSWSKRAIEFDSMQPISPWDELADPPDSTCAQVIHLRPEVLHNNQVTPTVTRKRQRPDNEHDNVVMCKDLKNEASRHLDLQLQGQSHSEMDATTGIEKEKPFDLESEGDGKKLEKRKVDLNYEAPANELGNNGVGLGGGTTDITIPQVDSLGNEVQNHPSSNISNIAAYDSKEVPSLELSLKQVGDASDIGTSAQECNILRHSGPSAFSRYNKSKIANQAPTGNVGSCSPFDNSSEAAKIESAHNLISSSSGTPNARSNGSSNNNDMGSTTNNASTKPEALGDRSMPKSAVNSHHRSAFQPVQHDTMSSLQPVSASQASAINQEIQVQHHHHHYHHHHHHVHNLQQQQQLNRDGLPSMAKASHCAPSDIFAATFEGNAANYGSASGSSNGSGQTGSSGQNRSSTAIVAEGTYVTNDKGEGGKCGTGCEIVNGSRNIIDPNRLAKREAALNKFQQKKKARCFEKKVRYQSRQKLAEQRPRVRGQFVRKAADEIKEKTKPRMQIADLRISSAYVDED